MLLTSTRLMQNRACFFFCFVHCHLRCCRRCRHFFFFFSDFFVHPVCCYCHLAFSHEKAHSQSMPTIWCGPHDRCLTCSHIRFITEKSQDGKSAITNGWRHLWHESKAKVHERALLVNVNHSYGVINFCSTLSLFVPHFCLLFSVRWVSSATFFSRFILFSGA